MVHCGLRQCINVSVGGVCSVWQRHCLFSKHDRLLRLEKVHREQTMGLNDELIRLLERFRPKYRKPQIERSTPLGSWWLWAPYSSPRRGRLNTCEQSPDLVLNEILLLFFEDHELRVYNILSDNEHEFY